MADRIAEQRADLIQGIGRVSGVQGLRITAVETVLLSHQGEPLRWSGGTLRGFTAGLVRITTDAGIYGLGESYAGFFAPEVMASIVDFYRPLLIGRDPSAIAELWETCYSRSLYWGRRGINVSVLSAIESALWDLCGKAAGRPVHELLGGARSIALPIYASGGMDQSDEDLTSEQEGYARDGYRASKIRIGHDVEADRHKVEIARRALGPGLALAADAVQGSNPDPWSAETAVAVGRALEPFDLLWLEEPCAADDVEGYRLCRQSLSMPIAGGETATTSRHLISLIEDDCFDIAQPDAAHLGGILEVVKVGVAAQKRDVALAMHVWGCGVGMMANYHAGFATDTCAWLEFPTVANPLRDLLLVEPLGVVDGAIAPPAAPGLGVDLSPEVEHAYAYKPGGGYRFGERQ